MSSLIQAVVFGVLGYLLTAVASYFLILKLSSNQHDRAVEAAMSSIFVFGPIGAVVAGVVALAQTSP